LVPVFPEPAEAITIGLARPARWRQLFGRARKRTDFCWTHRPWPAELDAFLKLTPGSCNMAGR
jgi:hypothetical protein